MGRLRWNLALKWRMMTAVMKALVSICYMRSVGVEMELEKHTSHPLLDLDNEITFAYPR